MNTPDLLLIILTLPIVYTAMVLAMFNHEYKKDIKKALQKIAESFKLIK